MSSDSLRAVSSYPAIVGQVLCELRKAAGLEQAELARAIGVTQSTWSRIETGSSALTIEQLADAAEMLGVERSKILSLADSSADDLTSKGVEIMNRRISGGLDRGLMEIGAAAIGTLVALLLQKNK